MPRKILNDRYLLDACKIYKSYPLVEIPHYKAKVPYFTEGMTSKAQLLVNNAPQQRPENPVAEAMSALSSNQRPAKVLEVSQQLVDSVSEDDWLRGFLFSGFETESETSSEGGPDVQEMEELRREAGQVAAYLRAQEAGTPQQMPGVRPTGMPQPTTPNPLFREAGRGSMTELSAANLRGLSPGQYVFETMERE